MPPPPPPPLDEVKKIVKGLLISCKKDLTLRKLLSDYEEIEMRRLPFYEFGYKTPLDFLASMSDTVHVSTIAVFTNTIDIK